MNQIIKDDLYRYIGKDCYSIIKQIRYILFTPGFQYIYFFRHVQLSKNIFKSSSNLIALNLSESDSRSNNILDTIFLNDAI